MYGIFIAEHNRDAYGMSNPEYATVADYLTVGHHIVEAQKVEGVGLALTGLTVDVDPRHWGRLDALEGGYDRITVQTEDGEPVWMYASKQ